MPLGELAAFEEECNRFYHLKDFLKLTLLGILTNI